MVLDLKEFEEGVREAVAKFDEWFGQVDGRKKVNVMGFEPMTSSRLLNFHKLDYSHNAVFVGILHTQLI